MTETNAIVCSKSHEILFFSCFFNPPSDATWVRPGWAGSDLGQAPTGRALEVGTAMEQLLDDAFRVSSLGSLAAPSPHVYIIWGDYHDYHALIV